MTTARNTRRTDPHTSYLGEVESRHRAHSLVSEVAAYVQGHPGQCRAQIAVAMGLTEYELSKRLSDAERDGLIHKGEPVRAPSGRMQSTWLPGPVPTGQIRMAV